MGVRCFEQDDDVLAFLPSQSQDVRVFYEINKRFGGLDVAIAGVESKSLFSKDFLTRLRAATARLNATEGVGYALTLTNVEAARASNPWHFPNTPGLHSLGHVSRRNETPVGRVFVSLPPVCPRFR